ncbi:methyltransferase [Winogradskya consettensis]|uniref:Methyltransferase n=1 Tax=Winogradskya consettensis TaxID=113560 RepID=A0A919VRF9_9ACTN|nr:methyltransferase [Actinoplanes consettensis]GIM73661.1 methyltransferase [Actinoplanes consettensis]
MTYTPLTRMAFGYATSQILHTAVRLGVPEALEAGPLQAEKLAVETSCDRAGLGRLLRALTVLGVVEQTSDGYALTELGRPLCPGHPGSLHAALLLLGDPAMWRAWGSLTDAVRSGGSAFEHACGHPLFDHLAGDPGLSTLFNTAMGAGTGEVAGDFVRAYDVRAARTVVDIGGGNGTLLAAVLAAAPDAHGILLDSAEGAARAAPTLRRAAPPKRWTIAPGDFFDAVPEGDLILLKGILHDWDDRQCGTILRNCRRAIAPDGRLLVLEPVVPPGAGPGAAAAVMSDIAMLVLTGGQERTVAEYRALLAASGFALSAITEPLGATATRILTAIPC